PDGLDLGVDLADLELDVALRDEGLAEEELAFLEPRDHVAERPDRDPEDHGGAAEADVVERLEEDALGLAGAADRVVVGDLDVVEVDGRRREAAEADLERVRVDADAGAERDGEEREPAA